MSSGRRRKGAPAAPPGREPREQREPDRWNTTPGPAAGWEEAPPPRRGGERVRRPDPEPMETNDVKIVSYGTLIWAIAFLALLPFRHNLDQNDHGWWLYTCLAGAGLGLVGIHLCRRRRAALERAREGR